MAEKHFLQPSTAQSDHQTVQICHICGDSGTVELILVCPKCKTSCEHTYCRKVMTTNPLDGWKCDDCERQGTDSREDVNRSLCNSLASNPSGYVYNEGTHSAFKGKDRIGEKLVTKGKVKCLTSKEVIRLSSGSMGGEALNHFTSSPLRIERPVCSKTSGHQRGLPLKSPVTSISLPGIKSTNSMIQRQENPIPHVPRGDGVKPAAEIKLASSGKEMRMLSDASSACSLQKQFSQPSISVAAKSAGEIRMPSTKKETSVPKVASSAPSQKKQIMQTSTSVMAVTETKVASTGKEARHQVRSYLEPKVSGVENCGLINTEPKAEKFSRGPARDSSWKGQFKILDHILHNVNFENEARPCCRGYRKVLDCSKRMPKVLQFKLIHRKKVWSIFFQDGCPNEDDIGLYFYCGEKDRSSGYDLVLTFIEAQDLAMRCVLSGMELYLFTSKTLSADHQTWDGHHFLWGVLRKIGKHKDVKELYKELPPAVHRPSHASQKNGTHHDDDDRTVDMEKDRISGHDVGEINVAVPRDSSCGGNSSVGYVKPFTLQEIKEEQWLDCPPGFEEIHRQQVHKL